MLSGCDAHEVRQKVDTMLCLDFFFYLQFLYSSKRRITFGFATLCGISLSHTVTHDKKLFEIFKFNNKMTDVFSFSAKDREVRRLPEAIAVVSLLFWELPVLLH